MHESNIEEEIGQIDFNMENKDFYKGNIEYILLLSPKKCDNRVGVSEVVNLAHSTMNR